MKICLLSCERTNNRTRLGSKNSAICVDSERTLQPHVSALDDGDRSVEFDFCVA